MDCFGLHERRVCSHDGVELAYWISTPPGDSDIGLCLIFNNGIGVTRDVWQDLYASLHDRFTILFWDYRGTFNSTSPTNNGDFSISASARDLSLIIHTENLERLILIGWSMGVQVSIEAWQHISDRILGMFLIAGTGGNTYDTALGVPGLIYWIPPLTHYIMTRHGSHLNRWASLPFRRELFKILRWIGAVGPTVDREMLERLLDAYGSLDFVPYFKLLNALGEHAPRHLEDISVPVTILIGSKDMLTPPITGKVLRHAIRNATLHCHPDATHFLMLEYPRYVREHLEGFVVSRIIPNFPPNGRLNSSR